MRKVEEMPDLSGLEEMVNAIMTEGYTVKDFTSITDDELEAAYSIGFTLVDQGRFVEAEKAFEALCHLDHYKAKHWLGLGVARQQLGKHDLALKSFAMAGALEVENPFPALRAAESYMALGKLDEAESGITAARHWAGDDPKYAAVHARAELLGEALARRKEKR